MKEDTQSKPLASIHVHTQKYKHKRVCMPRTHTIYINENILHTYSKQSAKSMKPYQNYVSFLLHNDSSKGE